MLPFNPCLGILTEVSLILKSESRMRSNLTRILREGCYSGDARGKIWIEAPNDTNLGDSQAYLIPQRYHLKQDRQDKQPLLRRKQDLVDRAQETAGNRAWKQKKKAGFLLLLLLVHPKRYFQNKTNDTSISLIYTPVRTQETAGNRTWKRKKRAGFLIIICSIAP